MPPQPILDDALVIDLAEPAIRRALARPHANGVIDWSLHGAGVGAVNCAWTGRTLILRFRVNGNPVRQVIETLRTRPNFGGSRLWFVCPQLRTPVRALVLPVGAQRWAGRRAHGVSYASQRAPRAAECVLATLCRDLRRGQARARRNAVRALRRRERLAAHSS